MEVEIEEQCINLLALQQPMARDLRMLTSALKIANDLERVGDHAVNIAQSAERLIQSRPIAPEPEIVEMARLARGHAVRRARGLHPGRRRRRDARSACGTTRWTRSTGRCSGSCSRT